MLVKGATVTSELTHPDSVATIFEGVIFKQHFTD